MKRSIPLRRTLILASLVAALGGQATERAAFAGDGSPDKARSWMGDFLQQAEEDGYTVAGLSPASSRFIPSTPYAAFKLRRH
jgi:hypothetical protein